MVSGHSFGSSILSPACITFICSVQCFPGGHSLCLGFGSFFYPHPSPLFILPPTNQCDRCLVLFAWGLMAGGHSFASHGGVTLSIGGCLRVWCIGGAQASPSHEPLLSERGIQLEGPFGLAWGLMAGGRGFASHGGVTLSRGWLRHRWKPLDIPGTHLH